MNRLMPMLTVLLFALVGCVEGKYAKMDKGMPPLPWSVVQGKAPMSDVGVVSEAPPRSLRISWENQTGPFDSNYVSRVEWSVDLASWQTLVQVPFGPAGSVEVLTTNSIGFFRVCNTFRP